MHLTVQSGLEQIDVTISKIRSIAKATRFSKGFQDFSAVQMEEYPHKTPRKIPLNVETRWNSTVLMISTALELRGAVDKLCLNNGLISLNNFEWSEVRLFEQFLEKFEDASSELFSATLPTLSKLVPVMSEIREHLNNSLEHGMCQL